MKERKGEHPYGDIGQILLLCIFLIVWLGDSFFVRESTFLAGYIPLSIRLIVLVAALVVGVVLFRSGHGVVSHEKRPDFIVSTGAFRYVRHPLYLASMVTYFGLSISTASLVSFAVFVMIVIFYDYIAGYEERLLETRFGEKYEKYKKSTGKWTPKIVKSNH